MNTPPTIGTASASRQTETMMNWTRMTGQLAAVTRAPRFSAARSGRLPRLLRTTTGGEEDTDTAEYIAAHSDILRITSACLPR